MDNDGNIEVNGKIYKPITALDRLCLDVFEQTLAKAKEQESPGGWDINNNGFLVMDLSGCATNFGHTLFGPPYRQQTIACRDGWAKIEVKIKNCRYQQDGTCIPDDAVGSYEAELTFSFAYANPKKSYDFYPIVRFSPVKAQNRTSADVALIDMERLRQWLVLNIKIILGIDIEL